MGPGSRLNRMLGAAPTLTSVTHRGVAVTLRTPRISDADEWRDVRVADQAAIEPFWDHSTLDWAQRHTRGAWIRECMAARRRMRHGTGLHTVIEVDRRLAGQCDVWIDKFHGRSELGLWVGSRYAGTGVGAAAIQLVVAHLFDELRIERIAAPIAAGNAATLGLAKRLGFTREGVMRNYMKVGDRRRDHELWSLVREDWVTAR
ncbi:GNAT family N-acetyltransferase [Mycolicibacterium brisbanense]